MNIVEAAVRILRVRAHSRYELEQKLLNQGYDELAVNQAVQYVTERGYLNDAALCDVLLDQYAQMNKYSLRETCLKLRRRGLPADLITAKLAERDGEFEYQAAFRLAARYFCAENGADMNKLIRRLAAKGFKTGTVRKVLERLRDMAP
ncbi:regulatory protein RecX [Sporomusa termitida]|uniref:Regulatory protein RecX n=1 Tax=Sporomusa termitida TaxID=2377 RepID=A0A517DT99_9FIRM|nr:regulatory protein RecX [Sporomusa termitida]QDR80585.1 Regulatory protein RecX [Sporomusa termitida]